MYVPLALYACVFLIVVRMFLCVCMCVWVCVRVCVRVLA